MVIGLDYEDDTHKHRVYYKRIAPLSDGAILVYGGVLQINLSDDRYVDIRYVNQTLFYEGYVLEEPAAPQLLQVWLYEVISLEEYCRLLHVYSI